MLVRCVIYVGSLFLGAFAPLFADTIRLDFQGTITLSSFASVSVGDTFTGSVFYNSPDKPVTTNGCPETCTSYYVIPEPFDIAVNGSSIFTTSFSTIDTGIQVQDSNSNAFPDSVTWLSLNGLMVTGPLTSELDRLDALLVDFLGPYSILGSPQIPAEFPDLSQWSGHHYVDFATNNQGGPAERDFRGDITSITSTVVTPEPSLAPAMLTALVAICWARFSVVTKA
jgi:hypothetical protein